MKIRCGALGLALGILWGVTLFLGTLAIWAKGGTGEHLARLSRFYPGSAITPMGAFAGLIWAFVHAFVSGWILGALYNVFAGKVATEPPQTGSSETT